MHLRKHGSHVGYGAEHTTEALKGICFLTACLCTFEGVRQLIESAQRVLNARGLGIDRGVAFGRRVKFLHASMFFATDV